MQRQPGDCLQYRPGAKNTGHAPGPAARLAMLGSFVYRQSPVWAQETLISAKSSLRNMMREGASFETVLAQIDESQWWPEQALRDFQSQRLRTVVETSIRHVPYYRQRYGSPGDRKSTRLNSSHTVISYAVFCLKKKKKLFNNI